MPLAPLRLCQNCGALVTRTCDRCTRRAELFRGSASSRGYGASWRAFRRTFLERLVAAGIAPICGAVLPGGPQTTDSLCHAEGREVSEGLHLDHEPPLRDDERQDPRKVQDWRRIQALCARCHGRRTYCGQAGATRAW